MKEEMQEIKKQNDILKPTCYNHEDSLRSQQKKVQDGEDKVEDSTHELEEVIGLGRFSEGGKRPMKVRMRSQVVLEETMTRKGKLANDTESKDI
ncbi:hypothetical protein E2C01_040689 [Portunus trituberculatus]|uniref:Uncharacterized protein n=1 Tax=Portunus trituberculatus TaxID=210409 RepID=A0A5B7FNN1_PORTR|nr:hypothetical protein [Portunus trituberculatus]